ncbi:ABC transporter permease [Desmospora profundinema]|uniref:ABC transport system permease protein n=1 Tax=Desmospora profundinema TaxID=1571184 RepID=A0ABU1II69_9BACL|nr:ABC transporter permease [Desmospora profundinema]MDR6224465.1 putative ABC transport system permease protein [Desmospora profundinema]
MTFRQFAFNNVQHNFRSYFAYFLSSAFAVMIFFIYAIFIFHPDMAESGMKAMVVKGMTAGEYVIFVFSFLFVLYSVSAFLKVRQKEFGILTLLGATRRQLNQLVFLENLVIGTLSIGTGVLAGLLFSKAFLIVGARVLDLVELPFYFPTKALLLTLLAFFALFFVISMGSMLFVRHHQVIDLLQGSRKPKKEPKFSFLLSLLAAICLLSGYGFTFYVSASDRMAAMQNLFFPIIGLVCIGTYFLYTQFSVFLIHLLKRNRGIFWQGTRILWLSDLAYRMKDNARMFFLVTMVSTVAFTATGTLVNYLDQMLDYARNASPFAISYRVGEEELNTDRDGQKIIENELRDAGVDFQKVKANHILYPLSSDEILYLDFVKLTDYNRLAATLEQPTQTLKSEEAFLVDTVPEGLKQKEEIGESIRLGDRSLKVAGQTDEPMMSDQGLIVVVPDAIYDQIEKEAEYTYTYIGYHVPGWERSFPHPQASEMGEALKEKLEKPEFMYTFTARDAYYVETKQQLSATLFVGLFIAIIFFICAGSFIYFRLYTDQERDQRHYHAVSKIGLTEKEMKRSATVPIALLFFVPFLVAVVHTSVALVALQSILVLKSILIPSMLTIGAFLVLQLAYFIMVRQSYLRNLRQSMVR